jgi:hypothetical protein
MRQLLLRQTIPYLHRCALAGVVALFSCSAHFTAGAQNEQRDAGRARFIEQVRSVIEGEVKFAPRGASMEAVRETVGDLSGFIEHRSSARLSDQSQRRLTSLEHLVISGNAQPLSIEDVTRAVLSSMKEITSGLSDADILNLSEAYREKGNSRDAIILRSSGEGRMKTKEFISRLRSIRGSVQGDKEILNVVRMAVRAQVEDRAQYLSEAMPETFGSIVKVGMTPAQALLIIYSVASDDLMNFTAPELKGEVDSRRQPLTGSDIPGATASEKAYGVGGSFYSTPLDVIFNDKVINKLLSHLMGETPIAR